MINSAHFPRQVHFEERAKCPKCEKVMTACNLNTHIKNVHMKVKTVCQICYKEMPRYKISQHRRNVHNIRQPKEVVIPRTPNSKVRKTKSMEKTESTEKMKSMQKTKSVQKMVQQRQTKDDNSSMSVQEQVPVKVEEFEKTVVGESTKVVKEEFLPEEGASDPDHLDVNGNDSCLEEGTINGYQNEFVVFAGDGANDEVPTWWVEVDC